ncbi:MAG: hypothetical protein ACKN9U_25110 [Pirellulaceae bacterium]
MAVEVACRVAVFSLSQRRELAPLRAAPLRAAPLLAAPLLEAPLLEAPLREAPLRAAPLRAAPLMAAPLRAGPCAHLKRLLSLATASWWVRTLRDRRSRLESGGLPVQTKRSS